MRTAKKVYPTLSARDLLEMVTIRPARALKLERSLGRIAPGYFADAIAIPFSGATEDAYEAIVQAKGPIKWMMINGKPVN
jgi:cytosine/adenosine deaminase-related metal-dependent hydrolase